MTLVSDWLPKLLTFLSVVLLARRLGAPSFAHFAVALGWIGYAWWAVDLGQAGYSIRTLATRSGPEQRRQGSEIFSLYLTLAVVVTGGLVATLLALHADQSADGRLLLAMSPYLLAYALFPDWWLRARGMLAELGAANWAAALTLPLALLLLPPGDGVAYALALGLSPLAGALVALVVLSRQGCLPHWVPSWTAWRRHLGTSLKFSAAGAGGQISMPLALATMTATGDARAAGAFALGVRASASAANALWLLLHNALPRLLAGRRRITPAAAATSAGLPLLGIAVGVLLWKPLLLPAVGPSYADAGTYVILGLLLLAVWGPKYLVEIGLVSTFGDVQRIAMNMVAPVLVVAVVLTDLSEGRSWLMPATLLVGEAAAAAVGYLLLRRRTVPLPPATTSTATVQEQTVAPR